MDYHSGVVKSSLGQPPLDVHDDHTLLGWSTMVAPTSKNAVPPNSSFSHTPLPGHVSKLPRGVHEGAKMAPPLHCIIRKTLEAKQVCSEDIDTFLSTTKTWERYDSAFKILWGVCVHGNMRLETRTLQQMAGNILFLNKYSPAQARNAYSALLLLPGWEQLRFCNLLGACKRTWNSSQSKYTTFWDAEQLLQKLVQEPLDWNSIPQVRDRLIIVSRLLNLSRSIDLARTWRCQSQVGDVLYVLSQRKNQKRPQWEAFVKLDSPSVSPAHLLKRYVAMKAHLVPAGSLLLRQLVPPPFHLWWQTQWAVSPKEFYPSLVLPLSFGDPIPPEVLVCSCIKNWAFLLKRFVKLASGRIQVPSLPIT
jgi:hypothetical protein